VFSSSHAVFGERLRQRMRRLTISSWGPLKNPQKILPNVRHISPLSQKTRGVNRIDHRQLSNSSRRQSDPHSGSSLNFKKYTLPHNFKVKELNLPAKMSDDKKGPEPPRKRLAYIALGSNMGDRIGWIEKACAEMDKRGIKVKRTSSLWETEPMYVLEQDRFVNGACEVSL